MPWTASQFNKRHLGGKATKKQEERGAAAANSALASCLKKGGSRESCEVSAIRIGKSVAKKKKASEQEMVI